MISKSSYNISERKILLIIVDVAIIIASLFLCSKFLNFNYLFFSSPSILRWTLLVVFYYLIFGEIFLLYNLKISNNKYTIVRSVILTAFFTTFFYIFTPFISPELPSNRFQIFYLFLILFLPVLAWRFLYLWLIFSPKFFKNILIIGKSDIIKSLIIKINKDNQHNLQAYLSDKKVDEIEGFYDVSKVDIFSLINLDNTTEVIISTKDLPSEVVEKLNKELVELFEQGVHIISFETFYEDVNLRVPKEYSKNSFYKHLSFSRNNNNRFYLFSSRVLDIIFSIIGLAFLALIIPFLLIGNLLGNRGSLFYSQKRVGKNGTNFSIYKLRSMVQNAESGVAVWAVKNDVRITAFGKFLRNTRLDEFPQFYNILKGDMSIIGPRPERPKFVNDLEKVIPFYSIRNAIRPGLTGWAQVNYPYANTIEEQETKLRYDLYYIKERSAFLDFKILIKTITTVLFFRGQ
ncbi:exopolysaccharide biosynthesis polyprenyl glycosylphosphotransferase [uncultured Polaribacter sp.]|uniref:exopolysaccharide biosynthesis polyprenyl glycosylphosphotransferase n=1 Tax=uncultured Polaribacter sp. TaxID=174711 RepID=UPI0026216BEE|nr:exopolysaccharide biosynthesis polyprenyl glycosylphosphotransferase [uncultured Polaribacter sp.]